MNAPQYTVARKYAQAFLNVFADTISQDDFEHIEAAALFFKKQPSLLFFLKWPALGVAVKVEALNKVLQKFGLPDSFNKLVDLLAQDKRTFLIAEVLSQISKQYKKSHKLGVFNISSAHQLNEQELTTIKEFLAKLTGLDIIYNYTIDKKLIAGIRLQSDTYLWEYSIANQLNQLKLSLIR